MDREVKKKF